MLYRKDKVYKIVGILIAMTLVACGAEREPVPGTQDPQFETSQPPASHSDLWQLNNNQAPQFTWGYNVCAGNPNNTCLDNAHTEEALCIQACQHVVECGFTTRQEKCVSNCLLARVEDPTCVLQQACEDINAQCSVTATIPQNLTQQQCSQVCDKIQDCTLAPELGINCQQGCLEHGTPNRLECLNTTACQDITSDCLFYDLESSNNSG